MKLTLRVMPRDKNRGDCLVLCDEDGNMLPQQVATVVEASLDGGKLTVEFDLRGGGIRMSREPPAHAAAPKPLPPDQPEQREQPFLPVNNPIEPVSLSKG